MTEATFEVKTVVSYQDLWDAIWGSDGSGMTYWCDKIRQANGDSIDLGYESKPVDFKVHDTYEDKWHTVLVEQLAEAYRQAQRENLFHCGHYPITDLSQADACVGDVIVQLATFGEIVYG